jgi:hypothetical protein
VARLAINLAIIAMVQHKNVPRQFGRCPSQRSVAARAIEAELIGVHVWFLVAGHTVAGRAGKQVVNMTILALGGIVRSIQHKDRIMSKVNHAIMAVVTTETVPTETLRMLNDEIRSSISVTGDTINPLGTKAVLPVTIRTGNRRSVTTSLMTDQTKSSKPFVIHVGQG